MKTISQLFFLSCLVIFVAFTTSAIDAREGGQVRQNIELMLNEDAKDGKRGVEPPAGYDWYKLANHTHTEHSHDSDTPVWLGIWSAGSHGANSIAITDHRTLEAYLDPGFTKLNGCTPLLGEEWGSGDCHIDLLNIDYGDPMDDWDIEEMIPEALSRGATILVNHPFGGTEWSYYPYLHDGIEGIEIWNGPWIWMDNQSAVSWWHDLMADGRMVTGIGGSDVHYYPLNPLLPCNHVLAESQEPDDIQAGVEGGRIVITMNESSARCLLWCDSDLDGTYETVVGDNLIIPESRKIKIKIEVYDGEDMELVLKTSAGKYLSRNVGAGDPWTLSGTAQLGPNTKDFLRLELRDGLLDIMYAITNPIFVNY